MDIRKAELEDAGCDEYRDDENAVYHSSDIVISLESEVAIGLCTKHFQEFLKMVNDFANR